MVQGLFHPVIGRELSRELRRPGLYAERFFVAVAGLWAWEVFKPKRFQSPIRLYLKPKKLKIRHTILTFATSFMKGIEVRLPGENKEWI